MAKQHVVEPTVYPIKCPHCFMQFSHDKVHFRAATTKHYDTRVVNKPGGITTNETVLREDTVVDSNLVAFNRSFGKTIQRTNPVIDPTGNSVGPEYIKLSADEDALGYKNGVLAQVKDEFGYESTKRICPYCHNLLPKTAGYARSYTIALAGDTAVGKTVYVTTLINRLMNLHDGFRAMLTPLTPDVNTNYNNNYYKPMYIDGELPHHTGLTETMEPLIFQFDVGVDENLIPEHSIALSFYDVAGDGIKNADYVDSRARHLRYADAFLYLVDPLQTGAALRIAALNQHAKGDFIEGRSGALQTLTSFFVQDIPFKEKPTAIVLTKSDLLRTNDNSIGFPPESNIYKQYEHPGYLNMTEVDNINSEVMDFLDQNDRQFKRYVSMSFLKVKFFAVSALGGPTKTVEIDGVPHKKIVSGSPQEIRVEEPFLWVLNQLGIIHDTPPEDKNKGGLFSKIFGKRKDN